MEHHLLAQVQQLTGYAQRTAGSLYGINFPMEAREVMAEWIEASIRKSSVAVVRPLECLPDESIGNLVQTFMDTFATKIKSLPEVPRERMCKVLRGLEETYESNPLAIYKYLRHCVYVEQCLVVDAVIVDYDPLWADVNATIKEFDTLTQKTEEIKKIIQLLHKKIGNTAILRNNLHSDNDSSDDSTDAFLLPHQDPTAQPIPELAHILEELLRRITTNVTALSYLVDKVVTGKLSHWQSRQQEETTGSFNEGLDTLQLWCEDLAEQTLEYRNYLRSAKRLEQNVVGLEIEPPNGFDEQLQNLSKKLHQLLSTLVRSSFIVETHPPRVLKVTARFGACLRSLIGGKRYLVSAPKAIVASIVSEEVAKGIEDQDCQFLARINGKVSYYPTHMVYDERSRRFVAHFRSLCVDKIQRRREGEEVLRQKYCIKFETTFVVDDERFEVCALSLPVAVVAHVNQEMKAWGPIIWDDVFRSSTGRPFQVEQSTSWDALAQALNRFFAKETGRHLTSNNLQFLREKVLNSHPEENSQGDFTVQWTKLFRDPISILVNGVLVLQEFCFWEWFYNVTKLTKNCLRDTWRKGLIEGFISKSRAQELLRDSPDKTYLLRFTESLERSPMKVARNWKASVSITWIETEGNGQRIVRSLQPFTTSDLESRSLSDLILACDKIAKFLYPGIPTESVFKPKGSTTRPGYVPIDFRPAEETNPKTEPDPGTTALQAPSGAFRLSSPMLARFSLKAEPGATASPIPPGFFSQLPKETIELTGYPTLSCPSSLEFSGDQYDDSDLEDMFDDIGTGSSAELPMDCKYGSH